MNPQKPDVRMNKDLRRSLVMAAGVTGVRVLGSTAANADGTPAPALTPPDVTGTVDDTLAAGPGPPLPSRTVTRTADRFAGELTAPVAPFAYEATGGVGSTAYGVAGTAGSAARSAAGHALTGAAAAADTVVPARGPDAAGIRRG
ncbi:hypothetical protein [Streptomyces sp. NPDC088766]|uniref:hypothetical protein n=1 Tax=Streptomyces sp. NPDC088766 TaxID=3365893 RepID=UPI0037F1748C